MNPTILRKCSVTTTHVQTVDNRLFFLSFCESGLGMRPMSLGEVFITGIKTESSSQCTFKSQKKNQDEAQMTQISRHLATFLSKYCKPSNQELWREIIK